MELLQSCTNPSRSRWAINSQFYNYILVYWYGIHAVWNYWNLNQYFQFAYISPGTSLSWCKKKISSRDIRSARTLNCHLRDNLHKDKFTTHRLMQHFDQRTSIFSEPLKAKQKRKRIVFHQKLAWGYVLRTFVFTRDINLREIKLSVVSLWSVRFTQRLQKRHAFNSLSLLTFI